MSSQALPPPSLSREEVERYSRHLLMPQVGLEGQEKLLRARVLIVGAGGLGSPLLAYLAAAGVGTLGIVDFDTVDITNLHRQILYASADVGRPKLLAAAARIAQLNPHVRVATHERRLSAENAQEILEGYEVVVDGSDNYPTRYLVNDACVKLGIPCVHGSVFRFEGQVSVFNHRGGPCYRCVYPAPPPPGLVPSCAEGGVLGVLPGIIGTIQAAETIKLLLGVGQTLAGRLLLLDGLKMKFRELAIRKDPGCPACGEHPTLDGLIDYEQFCGLRSGELPAAEQDPPWEVAPRTLQARLARGERIVLVDVRNPEELLISRIAGSRLIPLPELPGRAAELDAAAPIVVYCRSGARSASAVRLLRQAGFRRVQSLAGGINAWADEVDPAIPRY